MSAANFVRSIASLAAAFRLPSLLGRERLTKLLNYQKYRRKMITKKIDLTQLCAIKEVQHILGKSEEFRGNLILQNPYYKKEIIEYVLSNIKHRYMKLEELTEIPERASDVLPLCPIEEKIIIRQLIQLKMSQIVKTLLKRQKIK